MDEDRSAEPVPVDGKICPQQSYARNDDGMRDLNDLYYFVQVVDHGGFAPAGRALGMPKSKLSRRIALLEERLGVQPGAALDAALLGHRDGPDLLRALQAMLVEAEAADEAVALTQSAPRGIVRMTCPVALLNARVGDMVAAFMLANPQVEVHLEETNRRVDVIAEGIDIAIRVRPPPLQDSELVLRVLTDRGQCLVAAPDLLARPRHAAGAGRPGRAAQPGTGIAAGRACAGTCSAPRARRWPSTTARGWSRGGMLVLRTAAVAGVGVLQLPTMMVCDQIAAGTLVRVLPDWAPRREIIHAVFASRRGLLPAVRALLDFLAGRFEELEED